MPQGSRPSSNATLWAVVGIGLGVLLLLLLALRGKGKTETTTPAAPVATKPARPAPADPNEKRRQEARWWYTQTFFDDYERARPLTGPQIRELFAEAESKGYPQIPGLDWKELELRVYELLLVRDPGDPDANRAVGKCPLEDYPDFWSVFRRMSDLVALPSEFEEFRDRMESQIQYRPRRRAPVLSKDEFARASALLDRFQAFDEKLRADPTFKAILEARERIKADPLLGRYDTVHIEVPPFILFYAADEIRPRDDTPLEKQRAAEERKRFTQRLESYRKLITDYLAFFRKTWIQPLGLPDFAKDQLFFVWVFGDRKSWEEYGAITGVPHTPGLLGYFNPRDHWVFLFEDREDRVTVENSLAHELTHQLHWYFSNDEKSEFHNHFNRIKAVWFTEGWAEYAGWTQNGPGGYRFGQIAPLRIRNLREFKKYDIPLFSLRELVKREDYQEWLKYALLEWLPKQRFKKNVDVEILASLFMELLYSQSWLLVNFLYEFEGGKYRKQALEFTKATLSGYTGERGARGYAQAHEVFARVFGLETDADWERLQLQYERFMNEKFYAVK